MIYPLLVFSDDWGRHPSSSQHLIAQMLPRRKVLWVNTIGTRPPRLDLKTMQRVLEKLGHWVSPHASLEDHGGQAGYQVNPHVISPRMWPSFASRAARSLNKRLLKSALVPAIEALGTPPIVITTLPIMADLVGEIPVKRWVYYCVDDFSVWPGYDGKTMAAMERELVAKVDVTVAVSEQLADGLRKLGASPHLLTHGVDIDTWQRSERPRNFPAEFSGLEGPFVVFWGVIDRRMDCDWLLALSQTMTHGSIVLIGPQEDPDPALTAIPSLFIRNAVSFEKLPDIAASASVLVMPYIDAPVTRAMQPLKLKEYLASERPVVVRALPATRPWADACDVCETKDDFVQAVLARLTDRQAGGIPANQASARTRLAAESWRYKSTQVESWIADPCITTRTASQA
jgi:glycosyltransferase involved in cell wall biosynthesis